jgi:WD40 repeat protein
MSSWFRRWLANRNFVGHTVPLSSVAFTPDSQYVLSADMDGRMRAWRMEWGAVEQRYDKLHTDDVQALAVSSDGRFALSSSPTQLLYWNIENGQVTCQLNGHTEGAEAVAFSADGQHAVSAGREVMYWDLNDCTGHLLPWTANPDVIVKTIQFSPDDSAVLALTADGESALNATLWKWDTTTQMLLPPLYLDVASITRGRFSPDGQMVIFGLGEGGAELRNSDSGELVAAFDARTSNRLDIYDSFAFSADGNSVLLGSIDSQNPIIILADTATGGARQIFSPESSGITSLNFDRDGDYFISASREGIIYWRIRDGAALRQLRGNDNRILAASFLPNQTQILSGGEAHEVIRWRLDMSLSDLMTWTSSYNYIPESTP